MALVHGWLRVDPAGRCPRASTGAAVCKNAMDKYNVEIAGGLGPTAGK